MSRLCPPIIDGLRPVARVRVLYADTDKMGIAYHAAYLRYMELGRVELIRGAGLPYTAMESQGLALPLTDIAVRYSSPALYDDRMTIHIGLSLVSLVRVHFDYRILVEAGDRQGVQDAVEILTAQTRHACVRQETGRPERMPAAVYELRKACQSG